MGSLPLAGGHDDHNSSRASRGCVVSLALESSELATRHETITVHQIAEKLAELMGFDFAGHYDPATPYPGRVYFVPSDTLIGIREAKALGILGENDLFGGVVPHPLVATKAITHPLLRPDAYAPAGWSHEFGRRVSGLVHRGISAFTIDDARDAGLLLLETGSVRVKPVRAAGGQGQIVISGAGALENTLDGVDRAELSTYGLVLEESLADTTTYSVGQVRAADLVMSYYGTQRLTTDNRGATVYGGSDLVVARGGFRSLLGLGMPEQVRLAIAQARAYDEAAMECFPGMFASRRNYDVARGVDVSGRWRSGVLEQSWRIGGASAAEVAALQALQADRVLRSVRVSYVEVYGEAESPPADATVYFRGMDEEIGPLTKYVLVASNSDPRFQAGGRGSQS